LKVLKLLNEYIGMVLDAKMMDRGRERERIFESELKRKLYIKKKKRGTEGEKKREFMSRLSS
jgi:hypothetical protein